MSKCPLEVDDVAKDDIMGRYGAHLRAGVSGRSRCGCARLGLRSAALSAVRAGRSPRVSPACYSPASQFPIERHEKWRELGMKIIMSMRIL